MIRHAVPAMVLVLITCLSFAQRSVQVGRPEDGDANIEIVVHVIFPNDRHAGEHITVLLEAPGGGAMAQAFTNSEGKAVFTNVRPGQYIIRVRDQSIKETATGILQLIFERTHHEYIRAEPANSAGGNETSQPPKRAVKVKIPDKAQKEFDKGYKAFSAGDTGRAMQHYQKAIELYPGFAVAYNNMAALYLKSKDFSRAREALNRALQADPDLALTKENLIRVALQERNFPEAIRSAKKALTDEPTRPEFLFLMCKAQSLAGNYDEALVYARKVYAGPHQEFELAHLAAGRALEAKHRFEEARAEYAKLLQESPSAPEAAEAKKSLARLGGAAK